MLIFSKIKSTTLNAKIVFNKLKITPAILLIQPKKAKSANLVKIFALKWIPITTNKKVMIKAEPKNSSEDVVTLHEGTKVFVLEELGNWKQVELTDKTKAWIDKEAIKEVKK